MDVGNRVGCAGVERGKAEIAATQALWKFRYFFVLVFVCAAHVCNSWKRARCSFKCDPCCLCGAPAGPGTHAAPNSKQQLA